MWKTNEQSGNALPVTQHNAEREAAAERVELHTADMRHLPFSHGLFDLAVSSMAITISRTLGEGSRLCTVASDREVRKSASNNVGACRGNLGAQHWQVLK